MLTISVAPASASSDGRRPGLPDVLADGQADRGAAELDDAPPRARTGSSAARRRRRSWAGRPCGRSPATLAVGEHGGGVVDVLGALGEADERDDAVASRPRGARAPARASREEVLLEQQVLGRVAGERELGEHDELRAGVAGARDRARAILRPLPAMSPTVASIWARAMRSGAATPRLWLAVGAAPEPIVGEGAQPRVVRRLDARAGAARRARCTPLVPGRRRGSRPAGRRARGRTGR